MEKNYQLSSLIHGQFKSESAFAEHIGWTRQRLNKMIIGKTVPTIDDVQTIAEGLSVPFMMIANLFLAKQSTNE
jgi:transcriptional regulator with XRE-family HTH domain